MTPRASGTYLIIPAATGWPPSLLMTSTADVIDPAVLASSLPVLSKLSSVEPIRGSRADTSLWRRSTEASSLPSVLWACTAAAITIVTAAQRPTTPMRTIISRAPMTIPRLFMPGAAPAAPAMTHPPTARMESSPPGCDTSVL